jgi:hypothetical protein
LIAEANLELDDLIDSEVVAITLYGGIELTFGETRHHKLQIESDFRVINAGESIVVHFSPAARDRASGLDTLALIFRETVISAVARAGGSLALDFSNAVRLEVDPDDKFEAWNLTARFGGTLVSLPGGGLG